MKIEKGMLISTDNSWYVVVETTYSKERNALEIFCICDNANNIYSWEPKHVHSYLTLREIGNLGWMKPDRIFFEKILGREIPYRVIVEVLAGKHDDRFDHWKH